MKRKDTFSGFKLKSTSNLTGYNADGKGKAHEPFFVQALLKPKKNDLFYVIESCFSILNEKNILSLYERILSETLKCLHASKGAFYLYVKKDDFFELINSNGITEKELNKWTELSESEVNELRVNKKAFYGMSNDLKVDQNSLIIPLEYKGKLYAAVKVAQRQVLGKFNKLDMEVADQMISFVDFAIANLKSPSKSFAVEETLRLHEKKTFKLNYFYEFISNELRRARRYQKTFSLIYFKIENIDELKRKFSMNTINKTINQILDKLNLTIRETDFIAEESESNYFIVLTETDYFGSLMTMRKIDSNLTENLLLKDGDNSLGITIKMSSASFPKDGTSAKDILKALSTRLEIAKTSISEKLNLKHATFWEILSELIGTEKDYEKEALKRKKLILPKLGDDCADEKGTIKFSIFHPQTIRQLENVIFNEISMNFDQKGILYVGNSTVDHTFSLLKKLPDLEYSKSRISLITKQCNKEVLFPNITYIFTSDDIVLNYYFIAYLNERYAYGFFAKKNPKGEYYGFHTSDSIFVENLIVKLQNHYMLQEQL